MVVLTFTFNYEKELLTEIFTFARLLSGLRQSLKKSRKSARSRLRQEARHLRTPAVERLEDRLVLTTYTPTTTADLTFTSVNSATGVITGGTGNTFITLRSAIIAANSNPGADTINVPAGTYTLSIVGNNEQNGLTGDSDILGNLTIIGANGNAAGDATTTIIKGGAGWDDKIIDINPNVNAVLTVAIKAVTIRDGNNTSGIDVYGGGIQMFGRDNFTLTGSVGSLTLDNVVVTNNHLASTNQNEGGGGLLAEQVHLTINNSTFSNNSTTDEPGGGIASIGAGNENFTITNSIVTGNTTGDDSEGAGIYVRRDSGAGRPALSSTILIDGNTISNNASHSRGGGMAFIAGDGANPLAGMSITVQNNDITGNESGDVTSGQGAGSAAEGGGLYWSTNNILIPFTLTKNTITGNSLDVAHSDRRGGGGIAVGNGSMTATFNRIVDNTIGTVGGNNQGTGLHKDANAGTVTATNNWWGSNVGPSAAPSDTAVLGSVGGGGGALTSTPFLQLTTTASPSTVVVNHTSALTTSFNTNSVGTDVSANIDAMLGLPVTWGAVLGTISGAQTTIQSSGGGKGTATATFTATSVGSGSASATVDHQTSTASISITAPNVGVTKTDGSATAVPGSTTTYTIVVSNSGNAEAPGTSFSDSFPASITSATWTSTASGGASGNAASGSGNISQNLILPIGGSVTYTVTANISSTATGSLSNTATVSQVDDVTSGNNSATDPDTLTPQGNLSITKTDGVVTSRRPGKAVLHHLAKLLRQNKQPRHEG